MINGYLFLVVGENEFAQLIERRWFKSLLHETNLLLLGLRLGDFSAFHFRVGGCLRDDRGRRDLRQRKFLAFNSLDQLEVVSLKPLT